LHGVITAFVGPRDREIAPAPPKSAAERKAESSRIRARRAAAPKARKV
jgi:hypothetical protein